MWACVVNVVGSGLRVEGRMTSSLATLARHVAADEIQALADDPGRIATTLDIEGYLEGRDDRRTEQDRAAVAEFANQLRDIAKAVRP